MGNTFKKVLSVFLCLVFLLGVSSVGGDGIAELLDSISIRAEAYNTGDDYPKWLKEKDDGTEIPGDTICNEESGNFFNRECTSWVWHCINTRNMGLDDYKGFDNYYIVIDGEKRDCFNSEWQEKANGYGNRLGHAKYWASAFRSMGFTVDNNPAVGSIAWTSNGPYGHVAWVSSIDDDGGVHIEEYNYIPEFVYRDDRVIKKNNYGNYYCDGWKYEFIHVKDLSDNNPPQINNSEVILSNVGDASFNLSVTATDSSEIKRVYATIEEYGSENTVTFEGSYNKETTVALVTVDRSQLSSDADVFNCKLTVVDEYDNSSTVSLNGFIDIYPLTFTPSQQSAVVMCDVHRVPYRFYKGKNTGLLSLAQNREITILGFYENNEGETWAKIWDETSVLDGAWVNVEDIVKQSDTSPFDSLSNYRGNTLFYMNGQLVTPATKSRTLSQSRAADIRSSNSVTVKDHAVFTGELSNEIGKPTHVETEPIEDPWTNKCGDNVYWYFNESIGTLFIKGTGGMYSYYTLWEEVPWEDFKDNISTVIIYDGVTNIGEIAFCRCTNLTSIMIPESVKSIEYAAFAYCAALTSITIPNGVTSIGREAFYQCTGFTSITIPDSVIAIGYGAFSWCTELTSMTIPDSVTSIGKFAFRNCTGLTNITIPDGVIEIGIQAFLDCTGLTSITIPNSVTSIGGAAFGGCTGIENITVDKNNENYYSSNNCLISKQSKTLVVGCKNSNIPDDGSVTVIGDGAFYKCTVMTSITIPNNVISIEEAAFARCTGLTSLIIPNSVTSIGTDAFYECTGLTNVSISDSVASIGYRAFANCTGITGIIIPDSVTSIGDQAFASCSGIKSVTIGNSVTSIGKQAFQYCTGLTSVSIPDSVTSIGNNAFQYVANIMYSGSATGSPWGSKSINGYVEGDLVYSDNTKTTLLACTTGINGTIVIPDSVKTIGKYAFQGCAGLTSITFGNSVTSIRYYAFSNCTGLANVYYAGSESDRANISIEVENEDLTNATWHYNSLDPDQPYNPDEPHVHSFGSVWQKDSTNHWKLCECGEKGNTAAHTFNSGTVTKPATTENTGVKTLTCIVCGYKKTETIPKISISDLPETNAIKGNSANNQKTYNYKTSVTFTANVPEGGSVQWYIDGKKAGTDSTLTVKDSISSYTVTVVVTDKNGNQTMDEEKVTIKNSFFDKLIWFFVHLFNPGAYDIKQ